jgi:bifunctional non-homologous end joining protein LigD
MGEAGATLYLERYGRRIGAPKCVHLAMQAERMGATGMARGFWRKAYEIEMGHAPPDVDSEPNPGRRTGRVTRTVAPARRPVVASAPVPAEREEQAEDLNETIRRIL